MLVTAKRYRTFLGGLFAWIFLVPVAGYAIRQNPDAGWHLALAILPVIPVALTLSTAIRFPDRFAREHLRPRLRPSSFAFVCTLFFALAVGLLEFSGLDRLPWIVLPVFMVVFWSLGRFLMFRRAREA